MKTLAILLLSAQLSSPQGVANTQTELDHFKDTARNYLLYRFQDAEFIQMSNMETVNDRNLRFYVSFSAASTDMDHCWLDMVKTDKSVQVTSFACMNHISKNGFVENINWLKDY